MLKAFIIPAAKIVFLLMCRLKDVIQIKPEEGLFRKLSQSIFGNRQQNR
jgi:hypothetical protein